MNELINEYLEASNLGAFAVATMFFFWAVAGITTLIALFYGIIGIGVRKSFRKFLLFAAITAVIVVPLVNIHISRANNEGEMRETIAENITDSYGLPVEPYMIDDMLRKSVALGEEGNTKQYSLIRQEGQWVVTADNELLLPAAN